MKHKSNRRPLYIVMLILISVGCAGHNQQVPEGNRSIDQDLIRGTSIFGKRQSERTLDEALLIAPEDVLSLTPEMKKFTRKLVKRSQEPMEQARRLVTLLVRKDFFPKGYYTENTLTASAVFNERSGNCLSYTNLFVAMARELGLRANFQLARLPASWSADSGYLVRSRHINVLISDARIPTKDWLTVDFNKVASAALYPHTPVSDSFALSSFYNNLAIDQLYAGDFRATVALLAQAIEMEPNNADAWVNLAAVYLRHKKSGDAQRAFEAALRAEPGNESALAGLARLFEAQGNSERAASYTNEIKSRRDQDPFFQFATAQAAYEQKAYQTSLQHINRAIELRERGAFYYLQALIYHAQGKLNLASASLAQAQLRKRSLPAKKQEHALLLAARINEKTAVEQGLIDEVKPGS